MYLVEFDISFIWFYRAKANRCTLGQMSYIYGNVYAFRGEENIYFKMNF